MLIVIYRVLKDGVPFHDFGSDYYNQFNKERKIDSLPSFVSAGAIL